MVNYLDLDLINRNEPFVICRLPNQRWGCFYNCVDRFETADYMQAAQFFTWELAQRQAGRFTAGALAYEFAAVIDPVYTVKAPAPEGLVWFGAFESCVEFDEFPYLYTQWSGEPIVPDLAPDLYQQAIERVLDYIYEGDIYQANFTFDRTLEKVEDPLALFFHLMHLHPVPYGAFIQTGKRQVVSISPELFIGSEKAQAIYSSPMKGTAARVANPELDAQVALELARDPKNCAENLMITDMVRNDLGRVAVPGSVRVDPLFQVDQYETVHQMISTVHAQLDAETSLETIFRGLFPAASITGAPKVRAMAIIEALERAPRGFYCGAIGCVLPSDSRLSGEFLFNVPIRTLICEPEDTRLFIGSGIVADSSPQAEWDECLLKATFSKKCATPFNCFETLLWTPDKGYLFEVEHLERLNQTLLKLGRPLVHSGKCPEITSEQSQRVKWIALETGALQVEASPLQTTGWGKQSLSIGLEPLGFQQERSSLQMKQSWRLHYNQRYSWNLKAGFDEVLFFNADEVCTEGAITNLFYQLDNQWYTPPITDGLLPGIFRQKVMQQLNVQERSLKVTELKMVTRMFLGNSLRGGCPVQTLQVDPNQIFKFSLAYENYPAVFIDYYL